MENKFKVGSVWRTRAGKKATIDRVRKSGFLCVYHEDDDDTHEHYADGEFLMNTNQPEDLMTPWTEPEVHEWWGNIYSDNSCLCYTYLHDAQTYKNPDRLCCVHFRMTDGVLEIVEQFKEGGG